MSTANRRSLKRTATEFNIDGPTTSKHRSKFQKTTGAGIDVHVQCPNCFHLHSFEGSPDSLQEIIDDLGLSGQTPYFDDQGNMHYHCLCVRCHCRLFHPVQGNARAVHGCTCSTPTQGPCYCVHTCLPNYISRFHLSPHCQCSSSLVVLQTR